MTLYRCEACATITNAPEAHENHHHDGAQTCWPVDAQTLVDEARIIDHGPGCDGPLNCTCGEVG